MFSPYRDLILIILLKFKYIIIYFVLAPPKNDGYNIILKITNKFSKRLGLVLGNVKLNIRKNVTLIKKYLNKVDNDILKRINSISILYFYLL